MAKVVNIPALMKAISVKVDSVLSQREVDPFHVFHDIGRYTEVSRNIIAKDGGVSTKAKKYPLIWVVVPYDVIETIPGETCEIKNMQIIIATRTREDSITPNRIEANFVPRLWPIYDEWRNQVDNSGFFQDIDYENYHTRVDQPYWDGKDGAQVANLFGDYIDAVQLKGIHFKLTYETCDRFRLIAGTKAN